MTITSYVDVTKCDINISIINTAVTNTAKDDHYLLRRRYQVWY